jgi:hypothetical protein
MARGDGRVAWIAVPAMLACAGVVGALLWLAAPGIPGAVDFIGSTLRGATSAPSADGEDAAGDGAAAEPVTDCRGLYPDRLWADLTWTPDVLLSPSTDAPATATSLVTALAPQVRITCTWNVADGRSIRSTVADVGDGAAAIAQAALTAEGFACGLEGERLHCERTTGETTEIHDVQGAVWLSSVLTGWLPDDYGAQTASRAFAA